MPSGYRSEPRLFYIVIFYSTRGVLSSVFLNFFSPFLSNLSFFHEYVCRQHLKFAFSTAKRTIYSKIGVSCLTRHVTPTPFRWLYGYPLAG